MVVMPAGGGEEQIITSTEGARNDIPSSWSPDGKWLVGSTRGGTPEGSYKICLVPISGAPKAETQMRIIASSSENSLWQPHSSPDGHWIVFNAVDLQVGNASTLYVVRSSGGPWTRITEDEYWNDKPRWAPDGSTIYFTSDRTGLQNVWGIRFDVDSGRPVGDPFQVTDYQNPGLKMPDRIFGAEISLTEDQLVLPLTRTTGNLWMLENVDR